VELDRDAREGLYERVMAGSFSDVEAANAEIDLRALVLAHRAGAPMHIERTCAAAWLIVTTLEGVVAERHDEARSGGDGRQHVDGDGQPRQ
jgi:hypothetical protein